MKVFECQKCGQLLYFDNTECEQCGRRLGFFAEEMQLSALSPGGGGAYRPMAAPDRRVRYCTNAKFDACNWMVPADATNPYCLACRLNRTVPDLGVTENILLWRRIESAKHRMTYGLLRLGLPVVSRFEDSERGVAFDFLSGASLPGMYDSPVVTGHRDGIITIDVAEADDAVRERHRRDMAEPYRTLLGHFRHEIGHYFWDRLVKDTVWHNTFRAMFGDERNDYSAALAAHYANGPPPDWRQTYISAYASAHASEDFAETWAHYLHIVDTLETAGAFGLEMRPSVGNAASVDFRTDNSCDFDVMMATWAPLTSAVNNLNQSMGQDEFYPFVLSPVIVGKLRFVHGLIHGAEE